MPPAARSVLTRLTLPRGCFVIMQALVVIKSKRPCCKSSSHFQVAVGETVILLPPTLSL